MAPKLKPHEPGPAKCRVFLCHNFLQMSSHTWYQLMYSTHIAATTWRQQTKRKSIMKTSFKASDALTKAIVFGGTFNGANFSGEDLGGDVWAEVNTYHDSGKAGGEVLVDECDSREISVGSVTLTREMFEEVMAAAA